MNWTNDNVQPPAPSPVHGFPAKPVDASSASDGKLLIGSLLCSLAVVLALAKAHRPLVELSVTRPLVAGMTVMSLAVMVPLTYTGDLELAPLYYQMGDPSVIPFVIALGGIVALAIFCVQALERMPSQKMHLSKGARVWFASILGLYLLGIIVTIVVEGAVTSQLVFILLAIAGALLALTYFVKVPKKWAAIAQISLACLFLAVALATSMPFLYF